ETMKLLRATLPASVELHTQILAPSDVVMGDPTQLHQVLMNLGANAGHAMRDRGGRVSVTLEEAHPTPQPAVPTPPPPHPPPGPPVCQTPPRRPSSPPEAISVWWRRTRVTGWIRPPCNGSLSRSSPPNPSAKAQASACPSCTGS